MLKAFTQHVRSMTYKTTLGPELQISMLLETQQQAVYSTISTFMFFLVAPNSTRRKLLTQLKCTT